MLTRRLTALILAAARAPRRTALVAAALTLLAALWVVLAFDMTTDTGELISSRTQWRRDQAALEAAFPQLKDSILVVVDGETSEAAEDGARRLAAALSSDQRHFLLVRRPDGGDYLTRQGLLFADLPTVKATTQSLIDAQPLLGALAADPSLRGVARAIDTAADGARTSADGPAVARLAAPLSALSAAIDARLAGKPAWFSWQKLVSGGSHGIAAPTRRLVLAQPQLRFGELEPGAAAVEAIEAQARLLQLDAVHGVRLGITGEVPLADEEFGSIRENIGVIGVAMALALMITLWHATRSRRIVAAIMLTIVAGLTITLALGLLAVHRLNVISVAFIPLFVGLGVDFGVQVSVRYNAERRAGATPMQALERLGGAIGEPLAVAALAIVLALCAFLPTEYVGIAELGVISALGMAVAFVLNVTLLPALLVWFYPWVPSHDVGWKRAAPLDRWLERNRRLVLGGFVAAMLVSIAVLPRVAFDFNPLHLRAPDGPAMRALSALMLDPDRTPNTINVLAPNADAAQRLAQRLEKAPGVAHAISIDSFVPDQQAEKLALIQDASLLLDATINPFDLPAPADEASTSAALMKATASLRALAAARSDATGQAAQRLATSFERLAKAPAPARATTEAMLVAPLNTMLDSLRMSLQATQVARASLPEDLRADWVAHDGRALVVASPAGNSADNATLLRFTEAVRAVAPHASGLPIATQEAARTVAGAFVRAGVLALLLVSALLWFVLRSLREVAFTLAPVVLSGFLTLGCCVVFSIPLNFANIIAFPLLFGVGVAFHIYFVMAWRRGVADLLQTSLARAVVFSALATGSAFGALWFSHHPGTASMGLILMISLVWTLICALIFEPALLGPPEQARGELD